MRRMATVKSNTNSSTITKIEWLEVAREICKFHSTKFKEANGAWRLEDTAKALNRSMGSISQYLLIGSWLRSHENQIKRCDTMKEALEYVKKLRREMMFSMDD